MALELAQRARRITGEIGDEGLKPRLLLGFEARHFLDGLRLGLARKDGDQLADFGLGLALGIEQHCWRLRLQDLDLGGQSGLHVLAGLCEPGEDAERQGRVGEIVGVLDMDIGGA